MFDAIFLFTEIRVWINFNKTDPVWQALKPIHGFGIFCFALINILKVILLIYVCKGLSDLKKAVQIR